MTESIGDKLGERRAVIYASNGTNLEVLPRDDTVGLDLWLHGADDSTCVWFDPSTAREVARRLIQAASIAERVREEHEAMVLGMRLARVGRRWAQEGA